MNPFSHPARSTGSLTFFSVTGDNTPKVVPRTAPPVDWPTRLSVSEPNSPIHGSLASMRRFLQTHGGSARGARSAGNSPANVSRGVHQGVNAKDINAQFGAAQRLNLGEAISFRYAVDIDACPSDQDDSSSDVSASPASSCASSGTWPDVVPRLTSANLRAASRASSFFPDRTTNGPALMRSLPGSRSPLYYAPFPPQLARTHSPMSLASCGALPSALDGTAEASEAPANDGVAALATQHKPQRESSQTAELPPSVHNPATAAGAGVWSNMIKQAREMARALTQNIDCNPFCCFRSDEAEEEQAQTHPDTVRAASPDHTA